MIPKLTKEAKRSGWTEAHLKKEWVGLTNNEVKSMTHRNIMPWMWKLIGDIEAKLKEKNT